MNKYLIHILFWVAIAGAATQFGGPYTLFNCWPLGVFFPSPVSLIVWSMVIVWVIVAAIQIFRFVADPERRNGGISKSIHLLIFVAGLSIEAVVANRWHPRVSCL